MPAFSRQSDFNASRGFEDVDMASLRVFLAVCETGNMTSAAEKLHLTQSAVSASVHRLEKAFACNLFDRTQRPVRLTTYGRILRERAAECLLLSEKTVLEMTRARLGENLDLRLGYSDSVASIFGPYLAQEFVARLGHFSAYAAMTPRITQYLIEDKIDIGINTDLVGTKKIVQSIPVYTEKFIIVAPEAFAGDLASWRDVSSLASRLPPIRYNRMCQSYVEVERLLRRLNADTPSRIETDSNRQILSLVSRGLGWSIVPVLALVQANREFHHVCYRTVELTGAFRTTNVIFQKPLYADLAEKIAGAMKAFIREQINPHLQNLGTHLPEALVLG